MTEKFVENIIFETQTLLNDTHNATSLDIEDKDILIIDESLCHALDSRHICHNS